MGNELEEKLSKRTKFSYGLGCIGRDMTYTLVTGFLMTYLTLAVGLTDGQLFAVGIIMVIACIWDAINDPMMGTIIDNTHTRYGKFKPYIITGAILNAIIVFLLFSDFNLEGTSFVIVFAVLYILWGMTYTMNDISYWSMVPSLTVNPREREKVSSFARIGASIGMLVTTALVPIITQMGNIRQMYQLAAVGCAVMFVLCQILVIFGVQEKRNIITSQQNKTKFTDILKILKQNHQLLAIVISMLLFNFGNAITIGFGLQYFYFDYGVYGGIEFTVFALVISLAQVLALVVYPLLSSHLSRRQIFKSCIVIVVCSYIGFLATGNIIPKSLIIVCLWGLLLFSATAVIQLLVLVLLADTIEYGQWKFGVRNESITFSLNPFVTKLSSALQAGVFSMTMILSGINKYSSQVSELEKSTTLTTEQIKDQANALIATIPSSSLVGMRIAMFVLPMILAVISYYIYRKFYKIDKKMYAQIIEDLKQRALKDNIAG